MSSPTTTAVAVAIAATLLLAFSTPCNSASPTTTCTSHSFSNNKTFSLCTDLPHLNSSLFWTYHPTNSTASIAFVAPPAKPTGWIAWAINPTAKGMAGSQSLIAFHSNGSMKVQTFNISSYGPVHPSPISINVSGLAAEFEDGLMKIFATVALPENGTTWNQVWQVGSSVTGGLPDRHAFEAENLSSKATFDLLKGVSMAENGTVSRSGNSTGSSGGKATEGGNSTAPSPSPPPSTTPSFSPSAFCWSSKALVIWVLFASVVCSV